MMRSRIWLLAASTAVVAACATDDPAGDSNVHVFPTDMHDVSLPLTEMARMAASMGSIAKAHEAEPVRPIPHMFSQSMNPQTDPVVQGAIGGASIASPSLNFEGMGLGLPGFAVAFAPPDTDGDIGPNHYVQIVNSQVTIFSRTGAVVLGPINTNTFFLGFAGACGTTNDGDGVVRYDRMADRWVIAQFSINGAAGPFFQCIAVSTTPEPTGTYNRYQFTFDNLNDYPKMGLWPDAYYFTFNMFTAGTFAFAGGRACAFDRMKMLAGVAATEQCFDTGPSFGGLLASDLDGPTQPPAGSPNFVAALTTTALNFWKFHADFNNGAPSFTGPTTVPVAAYTPLCGGGTCVTQPGTTQRLDSLADRLMNRLVYRQFPDHEALVVSHAVAAGAGGGIRWYEVRTPTTPAIFQQGTYAPADGAFRWMSSMAFDANGNVGLGFSTSSATINPSVRYTGRLASDALGTMNLGEATFVAGAGAQTAGLSRWGDYSSMNIDPTNDCTFWYTQEYMGVSGTFNWHTRVGAFTLRTNNTFTAIGLPLAIPDANPTGITSFLPVASTDIVASVSLSLNITHTFIGDLVVTLVAPSGTPFVVSNRAGGAADNIIINNLAITAFNGQAAGGTWQLKVQDLAGADIGALNSWSLTIAGNCAPPTHWSGFATPNLPTVDNGVACTSMTVAATGGSASAAKLDISGTHDFRFVLQGALFHNGATAVAFPVGTFPGGVGGFSFTNRAIPGFSGDPSGTWTLCITDTDAFGDTGQLNAWSVHD